MLTVTSRLESREASGGYRRCTRLGDTAAVGMWPIGRRRKFRRLSTLLRDRGLTCTFCGERSRDGREIITGPGVFICDLCVDEAQRINCQADGKATTSATLESDAVGSAMGRHCSFCGNAAAGVRHLVGAETTLICDECLNLCDEILADRVEVEWTTLVLRTAYSDAMVEANISRARQELGGNGPCRIVVLFGDGESLAAARLLFDRAKAGLADIAVIWEPHAAPPEPALFAVAFPHGPNDPTSRPR